MVIQNLNFFDKFGKNLNLEFDSSSNIWRGSIFFEPLSLFLFDNENIFILEEVSGEYKFPTLSPGEKLTFSWKDIKNENEFFIYSVEEDFELKNNFIKKQSVEEVSYDDLLPMSDGSQIDIKLPLQLNIAFNPSDEKIFERTLCIYYTEESSPLSRKKIAEIYFYGEGVAEDERFGIWVNNFGIKFNREDANILKDYDIKEALPDWEQLNLARKSLLVTKEEIYPYIGTYKGLSNFINMLGYKDILQVKEYWKNINTKSSYFNKLFLVDISDYLDDGKIDNINLIDNNKNLKFGKQFKKTEFLALVYQFTKATDQYDDDGIPEVEETTEFTVDEIFYKLNRLKDKLKNEFLPVNVKIKDVIGEFVYFQKITISFWKDDTHIFGYRFNDSAEVDIFPNANTNLILRSLDPLFKKKYLNGIDFGVVQLNTSGKNPFENSQRYTKSEIPTIVSYIKSFYSEIKNQRYPDLGKRLSWEYGDDPERIIAAPVVLDLITERFTFANFKGVTFEDVGASYIGGTPYWTLENLDFKNFYEITWKITKDSPNPYNFEYRGNIVDLHQLPHFLPYVGEYRVTAELHDFNGYTSTFSKFVTVEDSQTPQIIAFTRLEDKFNYRIKNLSNVRLQDFGGSTLYYPKVNVLDNEDFATRVDIYKNLLEWTAFFKNRYGMGQNLYDVELFDTKVQQFIPYTDPIQAHPKKEYWGLGDGEVPLRLSDFQDIELKSLYFMRFTDLVYTDDFKAGFYLFSPKPGQKIKMSLFSEYTIPNFSTLTELANILNNSDHPGINLFNYEVINGQIHAQAEYLSREMYHILSPEGLSVGSPSPGGSSNSDEYTFFLPKNLYSDRLIQRLKSLSPTFDTETLFLHSKTSDLLNGNAQNPYYWQDKGYWKFIDDVQRGYLPTTIDQNSFNINDIKLFESSFMTPENSILFFVVNNIDGKNEFIWTLTDDITGEEVVRAKSVPFFVWKFKDLGKYSLKVEVYDNRGTLYTNEIKNFITVLNKIDYTTYVEKRLNTRKVNLLN